MAAVPDDEALRPERATGLFRHQLDPATRTHALVDLDKPVVGDPVELVLDLESPR